MEQRWSSLVDTQRSHESVLAEHFEPDVLGGVVTLDGEIVMNPSHFRDREPDTIMRESA